MKPKEKTVLAIMISNMSANPDAGNEASEGQYVPLAALAIDGTTPAVGDEVEYTVRGKIKSIEGERACVTPDTVNDQPAATEAPTSDEDTSDDDMMKMAMDADKE